MNILIKSAKIIDPNGKHHNKIRDILIENGIIKKVAAKIKGGKAKTYAANNLHLSPGWLDIHANFRDPGFEYKEDINSGCRAAAKGGFTGVLLMPQNNPVTDNNAQVEYIHSKGKDNIVSVHAAGSLTKGMQGKDMVEMYDMKNAGAPAFTDDKNSVQHNDVLKVALLYAKDFDGLIMNYPNDSSIANGGQIHEGKISTALGLKGIPAMAEEIMIDRDISLCEYTDSKLHLSYISTKNSVSKIKKAKKQGINISADVALHNLILTDEEISHFDTRYKVLPPLRSNTDCTALIKGLKDGTIDVICTDHSPEDEENKKTEFDNAAFGIIGLETAFGLIGKHLSAHLSLAEIIEKIAINPRKLLQLESAKIEEGNTANLTLFDPDIEWEFQKIDIKSKSVNTPFIGEKIKGKALAIYNKGKFLELKKWL
jgi:dihydroorotase|tara:strand:+ start:1843 stop:3120 length:1278 start_codon:yes stop_codon:yes gene_type:complete